MEIYDNGNVRRRDRLLDEDKALGLLSTGEYGILSMCIGNEGYGIPLNYVWDQKNLIYIHCAPKGQKLDCIRENNRVSFCVVGRTQVIPEKFTAAYESIVMRCVAHIALSPEERMYALELLIAKYSPNVMEIGRKYAEKSFHRTEIIRLEIVSMTGKCKEIM